MIAHEIWPRPRGMRRPAHCKTQLRQHDAMVEQSHAKQSRSLATQKTVAQGTIATSRGTVAAPLPRRSTTAQNATGLRPKTRKTHSITRFRYRSPPARRTRRQPTFPVSYHCRLAPRVAPSVGSPPRVAPSVGPSSACRTARQAVRRNAAQKRAAHARIT